MSLQWKESEKILLLNLVEVVILVLYATRLFMGRSNLLLSAPIGVVSLNLSSMGLFRPISPYISNLTALTNVSLASNNFTGPIPNLIKLRNLEKLRLQENHLKGTILYHLQV